MQRGFEIPRSEMVQAKRAQQQHLVARVTKLLCYREASLEGRLRNLVVRARKDDRHCQAELKTHFFNAAARRVVKCKNCPLAPPMTFREQGHRQKDLHSRSG